MWEKRATSAEGKTIRIAESSDMDSWEALLDHVQKFCKDVQVLEKFKKKKQKWRCGYPTIPKGVV